MLRRFTNRFLAALAVTSAAIVLAPIGARSQQNPAPARPVTTAPVTTAPVSPEISTPADQVTAGGELEKVTGYRFTWFPGSEVARNRSLRWTRTLLRNSLTRL